MKVSYITVNLTKHQFKVIKMTFTAHAMTAEKQD